MWLEKSPTRPFIVRSVNLSCEGIGSAFDFGVSGSPLLRMSVDNIT